MELKRERVREHLLTVIEGRRPGDAIPSERILCATLGVSRPTLRAAVDELVATGLLVREHGRGMFVAPDKITQELVAEHRTAGAPRSGATGPARCSGSAPSGPAPAWAAGWRSPRPRSCST